MERNWMWEILGWIEREANRPHYKLWSVKNNWMILIILSIHITWWKWRELYTCIYIQYCRVYSSIHKDEILNEKIWIKLMEENHKTLNLNIDMFDAEILTLH